MRLAVYQVVRERLTGEGDPHSAVIVTDDVDGLTDSLHGYEQRLLTEGRGVRIGTPRALRGNGHLGVCFTSEGLPGCEAGAKAGLC
jgi:hypothetical protein